MSRVGDQARELYAGALTWTKRGHMSDDYDPRTAARSVLAVIQKHESMHGGGDLFAAPGMIIPRDSVACAAVRYSSALGPDDTDDHGREAYAWVAGVMAGHHVTADPRVAGV